MDDFVVSSTRFYLRFELFGPRTMAGLKTQSLRFWTEQTIVQFETRLHDKQLVRLGGRNKMSCWGYAAILSVERDFRLHDITQADVDREGAPAGFDCQQFLAKYFPGEDEDSKVTRVRFQYVGSTIFVCCFDIAIGTATDNFLGRNGHGARVGRRDDRHISWHTWHVQTKRRDTSRQQRMSACSVCLLGDD